MTVTDTSKKSTNKYVNVVAVVLEVLGEKMMLVLYRLLLEL